MHIYIYIYRYACIYISLSLYIYIYISLYIYIYIYIYTHTHTHSGAPRGARAGGAARYCYYELYCSILLLLLLLIIITTNNNHQNHNNTAIAITAAIHEQLPALIDCAEAQGQAEPLREQLREQPLGPQEQSRGVHEYYD